MKKRTLKSLELNKKTVSNLEISEVKGGTILSAWCGYYVVTLINAIDNLLSDEY